jgi:hypothetical protein
MLRVVMYKKGLCNNNLGLQTCNVICDESCISGCGITTGHCAVISLSSLDCALENGHFTTDI